MNLLTVVWDKTIEYIKSLPSKFPNDQLYVVFGPVFDYDADGLADTNLTAARLANYLFSCCMGVWSKHSLLCTLQLF